MAKKCQIYNRNYQIQDIKDVQQKNINKTWYYWKFPMHPVAAEKLETRGINTILSHYRYRVDPKLGNFVCAVFLLPCECTAYIYQLYKYWLPTLPT